MHVLWVIISNLWYVGSYHIDTGLYHSNRSSEDGQLQINLDISYHMECVDSNSKLIKQVNYFDMMKSSNANIFRVTGPLCGEIHRTKARDAELWCFLWSAPK